jgi:hypothetical protein
MVEFTGDYDMISCWEEALDGAVQAQFGRLFDVLLRDPSEQGMKRFGNGIKLLSETERAVRNMMKKAEGKSSS